MRLPLSIRFILANYLGGLIFFTAYRLVLIFTNLDAVRAIEHKWSIMAQAMFMGLRFDTVMSGYLLAAPIVVCVILDNLKLLHAKVLLFSEIFIGIVYSIAFFGCAADIPFFNTFNARLNVTALNWTDSPLFMIKMIFGEWRYLVFFLVFVVSVVLFCIMLARIYRRFRTRLQAAGRQRISVVRVLISLCFLALTVLGIRGRVDEKSPITPGTAYFSRYDFANQAGLNPMFTFMRSWLDSKRDDHIKLHLINDSIAMKNAQYYLGILPGTADTAHPIARLVDSSATPHRYNVVVVIMESMSAEYLEHFGDTLKLTPNLDSLSNKGLFFDNFYSAGIHTFNGIYSTIYSFPALMAKHTMEDVKIPVMSGLPYTAKSNGYKTLYFTTHDDQFDNVGGFLAENNIDTLISKKDYPSDQVLSTLGVPDHFMFDFSIPILTEAASNGPFCAYMMTASNHGPFIVPDNIPFKPAHKNDRNGCVGYADWSIGHFISEASKQKWFSNTIFVFVADHGAKLGKLYDDMFIGYSHVPCIIYAPSIIAPQVNHTPGGQIDIFPTLASLLGLRYTNNTMGVDLIHNPRPYMYFSQDDKIGVADNHQLFIWHRETGREHLYNFSDAVHPMATNKHTDSMKQFAFSMLQATQWLIDNNKTAPVNLSAGAMLSHATAR